MGILRNALGLIVPIRESRRRVGTLANGASEVVIDLDGDANANVHLICTALTATVEFSACYDDTAAIYHPIPAYPITNAAVAGTAGVSGRPLVTEAIPGLTGVRAYAVPCGQYRKLRVRFIAYTSGNAIVAITADVNDSGNLSILARPTTDLVSVTAGVSSTLTATLPAVSGLRHIIDFVRVTRSAIAALTAAATPVVITSTNLPGSFALSMGQDAGGVGVDRDVFIDCVGTGIAAVATNTATTIVCPSYSGVIWRINVGYRLGL